MCERCTAPKVPLSERWKRQSTLTPAQRDYVTAIERLAAIQKLQEQLDRIKAQL
jgi:hypothetical protein